jgi:CDP-glucose 4,6-dehydratase
MINAKVPSNFDSKFKNKTVLVTGHTGFKGSWLTAWLLKLGANVVGIALDPSTEPSHFLSIELSKRIRDLRIDIRDRDLLEKIVTEIKPDFVFHLAAQAIVRRSYENPVETWQTNVMGTLNILESLRKLNNACSAVVITSDKCYKNIEKSEGYIESDELGGFDPYSGSKGAAEFILRSYTKSYFLNEQSPIRIASARAGNVIGGGDWAPDRIIPDCVRCWSQNDLVQLRSPHATRPWQHVLEPLSGYLTLALALNRDPKLHGEAFNFGPQPQEEHSVLDLVKEMSVYWDKIRWEDVSGVPNEFHESGLLKLNCNKALDELKWRATMRFEKTVQLTAEWYQAFYMSTEQIFNLTNRQIDQYTQLAQEIGLEWAQ